MSPKLLKEGKRTPLITWMKVVGIVLIVYGHVVTGAAGTTSAPINTKQLGVACFVFLTGLTLSSERRGALEIIVRRLCAVWVMALIVALVVSAFGFWFDGNIRESNYLPLAFGANILVDNFPANPTTWYVGTYIHLIVVAALLPKTWQVSVIQLVSLALAEVVFRAWLLGNGLTFTPYMLLPNWMTVYALGRISAQESSSPGRSSTFVVGSVLLTVTFKLLLPPLAFGFPFQVPLEGTQLNYILVSAAVTTTYAGFTLVMYTVFSHASSSPPKVVQFVADHTLLIFLAHMPIYYALVGNVTLLLGSGRARAMLLLLACILFPVLASVLLYRVIDVAKLRDRLIKLLAVSEPQTV